MRQIRPSELQAIVAELARQKELEGKNELAEIARQQQNVAVLAAAVINSGRAVVGSLARRRQKFVKPEDLLGKDFKRLIKDLFEPESQPDWSSHIADAKAKGLKGPW